MAITTCIFDAYGTLFDVSAAARSAANGPEAGRLADLWPQVARDWRQKQLGYSWLRATAGRHVDFWQVTEEALDWALAAAGIEEAGLRERLLDLYWHLAAYPEVPEMLSALKARGLATGILSNGSPEMLDAAVGSAGIRDRLDAVLSVESVGVFKPHDGVYDLVGREFGCEREEVLFVSANGWDAAAAAGYGFTAVWVDRAGEPEERLWARPHHTIPDLGALAELL